MTSPSPSSAGLYSLRQSAIESRVKGWEMGFLQFSQKVKMLLGFSW